MNQCVDEGRVDPDITEAVEPNGLGLLGEDSDVPAGVIELKPAGEHFVIHGTIAPFQDADGDGQDDVDADTYLVTVEEPTLLTISADGLHGLAAGFVSLAIVGNTDPLFNWTRFGLNLTGDTSKRQLFLPDAGNYLVTIADTRSLFLGGGAAGAAEGEQEFEYYVTVDQTTPEITPIALTAGAGSAAGPINPGEVKLFSVDMGLGFNSATLTGTIADAEPSIASLVVSHTRGIDTSVKVLADEVVDDGGTADPADDVFFATTGSMLGFRTGDSTVFAVDHVYNYAGQPLAFDLAVTAGSAGALSTSGASVSQPANETDFSVFFYDVASDDEITGMNLAWDTSVAGVVIDEEGFIFSFFTFDPSNGFAFNETMDGYVGLMRHRTAGRYYFLVFDPTNGVSTIQATSTYGPVTPVAVVQETPLTGQAVDTQYESNAFTYDAGTVDAWQQFDATGAGTGELDLAFFDPATSYGRLDPGVSECGSFCDDFDPIFSSNHPDTGGAVGRILLDEVTQNYIVTVNTATPAGTFGLDFERRPHHDFGTLGATPGTRLDEPLNTTTSPQRYLFRAINASDVTILAHPDDLLLDTEIQRLNADESHLGAGSTAPIGTDDTLQFLQAGNGWTAFTITSPAALPLSATFDLTVTVVPPPYTVAAGSTVYADACAGGTVVPLTDVNGDPGDDEARSAIITTPTGFDFFGTAAADFRVFANGFLSFDTSAACSGTFSCFFSNANMPDTAAPNALVAPYWDDLYLIEVCTKTSGTKLIVQWEGARFADDTVVAFQAILDGADDSVEFVYSSGQVPTGTSGTIGVENQAGDAAILIGFNTTGSIAPGTARKFTAN